MLHTDTNPYNNDLPHDQRRDAITARRKRYFTAGYAPLPTHGKRPVADGWQNGPIDLDAIESWRVQFPHAMNTGIRTDHTPAIDIDILDARVADLVQAVVLKTILHHGTILKRTGRAPKRLIPFRCDVPFKKIKAHFADPNGAIHAVEVLGDGQQFVAEGIHPDTGKGYVWEDLCLIDVAHERLPLLDEATAHRVMAEVTRTMEAEGWRVVDAKGRPIKEARQAETRGNGTGNNGSARGRHVDYARAALQGCAQDLAATKKPGRNDTLNAVAYRMATMAARGWITRTEAHAALMGAAEACGLVADDGRAAAEGTFDSGFNAGLEAPHDDLKDRPGDGRFGDNGRGPSVDARSGLPELELNTDPVAVAKKLAALISARRDVLLNGYTPVRVIAEPGQEPRAVELTTEAIRTYAPEICRPIRTVSGGAKVDAPLPRDVAQLYLLGLEGQWGLRPLNGISTTPLLGDDGSIRSINGYDEATGLWCHNIPPAEVPQTPTRGDAKSARDILRQAFRTFPFADAVRAQDIALGVDVVDLAQLPQLDESTHLVMLMTSVCRPCLTLAPGFLYNASLISGAGTGKGLLVKSACVVGSGAQPSAMSAGHDAQELDKRLVAAAIEARPAIYLDNFNEGTLESNTLASFLTESPARVRVLGQSRTVPLNTRALVVITGNAVTVTEDMARRVLQVGLDAGMENPEQRPFEPGFLEDITARRPELLSACLTIWRWGRQQRALPRGKPIGSYEQWALWCRDPLLALGCRDPIDRLAEIKAADPRRRQLVEVFNRWWERHQGAIVSATDLHATVKEAIDPDARHGPSGEVQYSRQRVSGFLRKHTNTRAGGFRLVAEPLGTSQQRNAVARYRLEENG